MRARLSMMIVLGLAVASAHPAHADRAKAESYFRAGKEAFSAQRFADAADNFELAYKELPLPEIAFSAAQAYRRQYFIDAKPEYVKRAVELYKVYLSAVKTGGRTGDASEGRAEMQRELDKLGGGNAIGEVKHSSTRLAISVTTPGMRATAVGDLSQLPASEAISAHATLDGKPVELYAPVEVTPGDHVVEVTADGYFPQVVRRHVVEDVPDLVEVDLVPRPGKLTVRGEAGATVDVNGRRVATLPMPAVELPAGTYLVGISRRGREPVSASIALTRGQDKTIAAPMVRTGRRRAVPWLIGTGGVLLVGTGVAVGVALVYDHDMSTLETKRTTVGISEAELATYQSDTRKRDDLRDTAYVLGGATVIAAATAAALYYFDTPSASERQLLPTPTVAPGGAGLAVVGTF